jgi:hypothetical protein
VHAWPTRSPAPAWVGLEAGHHRRRGGTVRDGVAGPVCARSRAVHDQRGCPLRTAFRVQAVPDAAGASVAIGHRRGSVPNHASNGRNLRLSSSPPDRALRLASGLRIRRVLILHTREVAGSKPAASTSRLDARRHSDSIPTPTRHPCARGRSAQARRARPPGRLRVGRRTADARAPTCVSGGQASAHAVFDVVEESSPTTLLLSDLDPAQWRRARFLRQAMSSAVGSRRGTSFFSWRSLEIAS